MLQDPRARDRSALPDTPQGVSSIEPGITPTWPLRFAWSMTRNVDLTFMMFLQVGFN
jgi:hypothetical protein